MAHRNVQFSMPTEEAQCSTSVSERPKGGFSNTIAAGLLREIGGGGRAGRVKRGGGGG